MKIQPIDSQMLEESTIRNDVVIGKPMLKSRLKRLFDRPLTSVLRKPWSAEKTSGSTVNAVTGVAGVTGVVGGEFQYGRDVDYIEPSSVCLDKMVQNFIEENNEKPSSSIKCGRSRCSCFNGNNNDSSTDEVDFSDDTSDSLKSLIPCVSRTERNLLADTSNIVEKNKACKCKKDLCKIVTDGLIALNYNASICKSKWEKSSSIPAGEYEYIDVIIEEERILIDVDFRSEFEVARSTSSYKTILQLVPFIFVGKADRILQIITIVSEAARRSLKKKDMHVAPWRKAEYVKSKWLSSFTRTTPSPSQNDGVIEEDEGELKLIFGDKEKEKEKVTSSNNNNSNVPSKQVFGEEEKLDFTVKIEWQPPAVSSCVKTNKAIVTGLASLLMEKS